MNNNKTKDTYDNIHGLRGRVNHVVGLLDAAMLLKSHGTHHGALQTAMEVLESIGAELRAMTTGLTIRSRNVRVVIGKWEVHCPTNDSSCIVYDRNESRLLPFYLDDLDDLRRAVEDAQSQLKTKWSSSSEGDDV